MATCFCILACILVDRGPWWATVHGVVKSQTRQHAHGMLSRSALALETKAALYLVPGSWFPDTAGGCWMDTSLPLMLISSELTGKESNGPHSMLLFVVTYA